jgi:hypothetical protein
MLQIRKYQYNNLCDTYGCNNRAKHSLGREGYPKRAAYNICDRCLRDIAKQVPLEDIIHRDDLQQYIDDRIKKGTEAARELMGIDKAIDTEPVEEMKALPYDKENPHPELYYLQEDGSVITRSEMEMATLNPGIPPDGEEIPLDDLPFSDDMEAELVGSYTYKELQGMAKELGIPSFGVKKDELQESVLKALKER